MSRKIRVTQIGLGPLGRMISPYLAERKSIEISSAVDIDPGMEGRNLGELCDNSRLSDIDITADLEDALQANPQVAVITTVSDLDAISPLVERIVSHGIHVVSTCEELSFPWVTKPEVASRLDRAAKKHGVCVLGTGVNPGFLMDFLPTAATTLCREVDSLLIERIQDASFRRLPFRQKIGAGIEESEFRFRMAEGKIRHVGLTESMHMVASRLGWELDRTEDNVEPVLAEKTMSGDDWVVEKGMAAGVNQIGRAFLGDREVLTLVFKASVGETNPRDRVKISGIPEVDLTLAGGVNGDIATCAIVTNAVPAVCEANPGLRTMVDMPPLSCLR
ncbi:MAG: dihydrodipicolinate reductase [Gemmatimonadetes bacterium]|nr:dihydrodipicolinate reductase [Gemmatimonadota bacterium]